MHRLLSSRIGGSKEVMGELLLLLFFLSLTDLSLSMADQGGCLEQMGHRKKRGAVWGG